MYYTIIDIKIILVIKVYLKSLLNKLMLVNIIINEKIKIGIIFKATDDVNRIINKLKLENLIPTNLDIKDITIFDSNKNIVSTSDTV